MTHDEFVIFAKKRFLSADRMDENFFQYLNDEKLEVYKSLFPDGGFFTYHVNIVVGAGDFDLVPDPAPDPLTGLDINGHKLQLTGASRLTNIPYSNDGVSVYWIALHYAEIPSGVYANPRTGKAEYDKTEEQVGLRDVPDAVTAGVGTITFDIDGICPSSVADSYAGRYAWAWLKNPQSADETVAIERCLITWTGTKNQITTTNAMGQSVITTDPNDYFVCLDGPCVYNNGTGGVSRPYTDDYLVIGYIDDSVGPPAVLDQSLQIDLSGGGGHSMQAAYDGSSGGGSGRIATIDYQAIELFQSNTTIYDKDIAQAVLRVTKDDDITQPSLFGPGPYAAKDAESAIDLKMRMRSYSSILDRRNLMDVSGSDMLRGEEDVELLAASSTVRFTRGGSLDLSFPLVYFKLITGLDLIEISGSTLGQNGLYIVGPISSPDIAVATLNGDLPSFTAESGLKARLYRPLFRSGYYAGQIGIAAINDLALDCGENFETFKILMPDSVVNLAPADHEIISIKDIDSSGVESHLFSVRTDGLGQLRTLCEKFDGATFISDNHYTYDGVQVEHCNLLPENSVSEVSTGPAPYWYPVVVTSSDELDYMVCEVAKRHLFIPIHLPDGAIVNSIKSLVYAMTPASDWMQVEFYKRAISFAGLISHTVIDTNDASVNGRQNLEIDLSVSPETIDNSNYIYALSIKAGDAAVSLEEKWYYSQIEYDMASVRPTG